MRERCLAFAGMIDREAFLSASTTQLGRRRFLGLGGATVVGAGLVLIGCGSDSSSSPSSATASDAATTASNSTATATSPTSTTASSGTPASNAETETPVAGTDVAAATTDAAASTVTSLATGTPATTVFTTADFADLGTCVLLPDLTQGPYPTTTQIERRDITEGHEGHPLRVGVQVVDSSCAPIPGAVLEIWHCDVDGDYSAYSDGYTADDGGPGTTFFRGSQTANDDGIVEFLTSYPGWYTGRAVHIHAKVHIGDATPLTTQFFFDDALNNQIMSEGVYAAHGEPDTTNETDNIAGGNPAEEGLLMIVLDDAAITGSRALIVVGVDPSATSAGASGGGMGGGGAPPGGGGMPPASTTAA